MNSCLGKILSPFVTVVLLLVIAASGVIYYWGDLLSGFIGLSPQRQAAELLPAETELYVGIGLSLNEQNQAGYENLKKLYLEQPDIQSKIEEAKQYLAELDIDFKKDVLTWIGTELAFAVPTVKQEGESGYLFAVATWNSWGAKSFIDKQFYRLSVESGTLYEQKEYKGVNYWFLAAPNQLGEQAAATVLNQFVVISNSEETLKRVIDVGQAGENTLAQSQRFESVFEALPAHGVLFGFFESYSAISNVLGEWTDIPTPKEIALLEAMEMIGFSTTLQADGIQVDTVVQYELDRLPQASQAMLTQTANPNRLLNRVPANAIFFSNSSNLNNLWLQARQEWANDASFEPLLAELEAETGINIQQDFFNWMTGEFAFVLSDLNVQSTESLFPFAGYLLVETNDLSSAQHGINKVTSLLTEQFNVPIQAQTISKTDVQVVVAPFIEQPLAALGFQENLFMLGIPQQAITTFAQAPYNPITNHPQFSTIQRRLPTDNMGYIYINTDLLRQREEARLSDYDSPAYDMKKTYAPLSPPCVP